MASSLLRFTQSFRYFFWPFTAAGLLQVLLSHPNFFFLFCTNSTSGWLASLWGFNSSLGLLITRKLLLMKLLSAGFHLIVVVTDQIIHLVLFSDRKKVLISSVGWCLGDSQALTDIHTHDTLCFSTFLGEGRRVANSEKDKWSLRHDSEEGCRADRFSAQITSWLRLCAEGDSKVKA